MERSVEVFVELSERLFVDISPLTLSFMNPHDTVYFGSSVVVIKF